MSHTSNDISPTQWGTGELSESERYDLLSNGRRRAVLAVLERLETPIHLEDLAVAMAAEDALDGETERQIKISLHHNHLPKMADLGAIDYDYESNRIDL
jgi:hypothetical protein